MSFIRRMLFPNATDSVASGLENDAMNGEEEAKVDEQMTQEKNNEVNLDGILAEDDDSCGEISGTETSSSSDTGIGSPTDTELPSSSFQHLSLRSADCFQISHFFTYWKTLISQEEHLQDQIRQLSEQISARNAEILELRCNTDKLQRQMQTNSAGVERLQAELEASLKECEFAKNRIKFLDDTVTKARKQNAQLDADLNRKTDDFKHYEETTNSTITSLRNTISTLESKISELNNVIHELQSLNSKLECERQLLFNKNLEEQRKNLETAEKLSQQQIQWRNEREQLRTANILKEQQLLDDFEWKLREVQQQCKQKLNESAKIMDKLKMNLEQANTLNKEMEDLTINRLEADKLRIRFTEMEDSLRTKLNECIEQKLNLEQKLRDEITSLEKQNEEDRARYMQIEDKYSQEMEDKDRQLRQLLQRKHEELSSFWEKRFLNECSRLKTELEQMHNEEKVQGINILREEYESKLVTEKSNCEKQMSLRLDEILDLKRKLTDVERLHRDEMLRFQSQRDSDMLELRRTIDKIDAAHHERYDKAVADYEQQIETLRDEYEQESKEAKLNYSNELSHWQQTVENIKNNLTLKFEQQIASLIKEHQLILDAQVQNLEQNHNETITSLKTEFEKEREEWTRCTQLKANVSKHREDELQKNIDNLESEVKSFQSIVDELHNKNDILQNRLQSAAQQECGNQSEYKRRKESESQLKIIKDNMNELQEQHEKEKYSLRTKMMRMQKQSQETIDHLHRKYQCLSKLFDEVRSRYDKRESRPEDLATIEQLRCIIMTQKNEIASLSRTMNVHQNINKKNTRIIHSDEEEFQDAITNNYCSKEDVNEPQYPPHIFDDDNE